MTTAALEGLPAGLRKKLDGLVSELKGALGDELVAVMLFGSAARGEFREGRSDVDLVVVLSDATAEALDRISNPLRLALFSSRIEAMVLVESEISRAADVFPLFYDDIRSCHVLLHGRDPFASLEINNAHRRLRIEQELREASIRLRRAVIDAAGQSSQLSGLFERKLRQIRGPLRALLALHGQQVGQGLYEVIDASGALFKIDVTPLRDVRADVRKAQTTLVALLQAAVDDADRLEVGPATQRST